MCIPASPLYFPEILHSVLKMSKTKALSYQRFGFYFYYASITASMSAR